MTSIHHQIGTRVDIKKVYDAITSLKGLSSWWTKTTGKTGPGEKLNFHFGVPDTDEHIIEMTIIELIPDKKVVWRCTAKEGEWKDTIISYDLIEKNEQVFINFAHSNWAEQSDLCSHCNTKWAVFLLSLKDYLETGKGRPFPDDIQINHLDG